MRIHSNSYSSTPAENNRKSEHECIRNKMYVYVIKMSNIKIIKMSGNEKKGNDMNTISVKVGCRSPAHHHDRNKSVVKAYRAGDATEEHRCENRCKCSSGCEYY